MKMLAAVVLLVGISAYIYFMLMPKSFKAWNGYKVISYSLDGKEYKLAVAENNTQWTQGLMYVKKPLPIDGMIFMFPDTQYRMFWNENTHIHLQLYWLKDDLVLGQSDLPSIDESKSVFTVKSPQASNRVIEIIK